MNKTSLLVQAGGRQFILYCILAPIATFASTLFAMSLQPVIDTGLSRDLVAFGKASVFTVILVVVDGLTMYWEQIQKEKVVTACTRELRLRYFKNFLQQRTDRFFGEDSASYISKITLDTETISEKYCRSILNIYKSVWSLVISISFIVAARWELALFVIVFSLLTVNLPKLFQKGADKSEADYLESSAGHLAKVKESIHNFLVIRLHGLEQAQNEDYRMAAADVEKSNIDRQKKILSVNAAACGISGLSFVLIIIFCMVLVLLGKLSVGYTMSVSQLLGGIMAPFEMLPGYLLAYRTGRDLYRANASLSEDAKDRSNATVDAMIPLRGSIQIKNVSFAYADSPDILNGIELSMDFGKKYALVGTSGSGKSTLAKILMGFFHPTKGQVLIGGVPLDKFDKEVLYKQISYQSQSVTFFNDTVKNNILLGEEVTDERWSEIVRLSQLNETLEKFAEGENTTITEEGKNISGGEAQRVGLARCLARSPVFMVFDEITASLDNKTAGKIEETLHSFPNAGILLITHRVNKESMKGFDSIFVLDHGKIIEQGTMDELMEKQGSFYHLVNGSSVDK